MRIPPGLAPKFVTSTNEAAAATGGNTTPEMAISAVLKSAASPVLIRVIVDLQWEIPAFSKIGTLMTAVNNVPNIRSHLLGALTKQEIPAMVSATRRWAPPAGTPIAVLIVEEGFSGPRGARFD
jgi:hypothetical protein